jgi:hypothetical protein
VLEVLVLPLLAAAPLVLLACACAHHLESRPRCVTSLGRAHYTPLPFRRCEYPVTDACAGQPNDTVNSLNALLGQQNKEQTAAEKPAAPAKKPGGMSKAQVRS